MRARLGPSTRNCRRRSTASTRQPAPARMAVPSERICVTRRAVLGFPAARSIDGGGRIYAEPEASRAVQEAYPAPVRNWISRRGGLTSRLLLLRGRELAAIYPTCR